MNKHDLEHRLAQMADGGVLVEIGVGNGNGLRAMWAGTRLGRQLPLYAVDPYEEYTDLNGAHYGPGVEAELHSLLSADPLLARDVTPIKKDGATAGKEWAGLPVAMVWIDMTDPVETLRPIVEAWLPHIVPGGYMAICNLEYESRGCGARQVTDYVRSLEGWHRVDIEGQQVAGVLQKDYPRRCVLYLVYGDQYVTEAATSANSVRRYMRTADTVLFCHAGAAPGGHWTHVQPTLKRQHKTWYCDSVMFLLQAMEALPYDEILHLDCDTILAHQADELWLILQEADLAFGYGGERDNNKSIYGAPAAFTTPMVGVNLYRNTPKVRAFVREWLRLYEQYEDFYGENEQYPLRDLLWKNEMGMRYIVLPDEFACRYNFGCWAKGMVRVMHGRLPLLDKTLEQAAAEINSDHTMRLYHPRFGMLWSVEKERSGLMR